MSRPNAFSNSKWKLTFSNIPTINNYRDLSVYDEYVKNIIIPDYNIDTTKSSFFKHTKNYPVSKINETNAELSIDFVASEYAENYINLLEYLQKLKYGQNLPETYLKDNVVKRLNVIFLDNQKRSKKIIYFTQCYLSSIGSLDLTNGTDDEIIFNTIWQYDEMLVDTP